MTQAPISATAAEAFVQTLIREGVDTTFGIASGYLSPFLDAIRRGGVRVVTNLHEGAAGCAAAGYALASGKLGVVFAQAGPGVTNTITGIAAAYMDSVPQLLVATQSPLSLYGRDAHQEASGGTFGIDQYDMFRSTTTARYRPTTGDSLIRCTRRALAAIHNRHSTAMVEVATDLWLQRVMHADLEPEQYRPASAPIDVRGIEEVARMLRGAKSPALLIGHRYVHRGGSRDLIALCEEQDIPCATVDSAKGAIPEDHPLSLGVFGQCGHEPAMRYIATSDLVIALGMRMSSANTFDFDASIFPNLVHIDEIAEEPGRNHELQLGLVSDLVGSVSALRTACGAPRTRGARALVRALREEHRVYQRPTDRGSRSTPSVLHAVREVLPRQALVAGDSGLTLQYLKHFFPVYAPDGFFNLYSFAAMGAGLPLGVGVQLARPEEPVLCVVGDGGALVHLSELAVAAQYQLPLIVLLINNGGYRQVGDRMERYQTEAVGCQLPPVDFCAAARACGCDAYLAHDPESAAAAVAAAVARGRAALVEVKVEGDNLFDIIPERIRKWWDRMFDSAAGSNAWPFETLRAKTSK